MFVYITYCIPTGKGYIGKHEGSEDDKYLGSGTNLKKDLKKYGTEAFQREILERYNTSAELIEGEKRWIHLFDAVNSNQFYNIAAGGEGGNTYAGIKGRDREELTLKLKRRRKRKPPVDQAAYLDLLTGLRGSCNTEEFQSNPYYIGVKSKYLYNTPKGLYSSLKVAFSEIKLDMASLAKRCKENTKVINKRMLAGTHNLTEHDALYLGKTFKDAGYSCIPVEEFLSLDILKKKTYKIKK